MFGKENKKEEKERKNVKLQILPTSLVLDDLLNND